MIKNKDQSWGVFFLELGILVVLVLGIRFYVFQFFRISGPSMCPTLNFLNDECIYKKGEFIFVNEFLYHFIREPERGEIVVFRPPNRRIFYVKRIIGVGGDEVEIRDGKVFLTPAGGERERLIEPYLSAKNRDWTQSYQRQKFVVPSGHYLLFGDNRSESMDSRQCFSGGGCDGSRTPFVPASGVQGRAEFVVWPFWEVRFLEHFSSILDRKDSEQNET